MGIAGDEKAIIEEYIDKQPDSDLAGVQIREKGPTGYEPASHEERALDKRIDRKFDFILLPIMSVNYALAGLDKNSLGRQRPLHSHRSADTRSQVTLLP